MKVEVAYNDPAGHTKRFEEHGWDVVRAELGLEDDGVEFVGRYNEVLGRFSHQSTKECLIHGRRQVVMKHTIDPRRNKRSISLCRERMSSSKRMSYSI